MLATLRQWPFYGGGDKISPPTRKSIIPYTRKLLLFSVFCHEIEVNKQKGHQHFRKGKGAVSEEISSIVKIIQNGHWPTALRPLF